MTVAQASQQCGNGQIIACCNSASKDGDDVLGLNGLLGGNCDSLDVTGNTTSYLICLKLLLRALTNITSCWRICAQRPECLRQQHRCLLPGQRPDSKFHSSIYFNTQHTNRYLRVSSTSRHLAHQSTYKCRASKACEILWRLWRTRLPKRSRTSAATLVSRDSLFLSELSKYWLLHHASIEALEKLLGCLLDIFGRVRTAVHSF